MTSPQESANRTRKAIRLADSMYDWVCEGTGQDPTDPMLGPESMRALTTLMSDDAWVELARFAGVEPPSEATKAVVQTLLQERGRTDDPFGGF